MGTKNGVNIFNNNLIYHTDQSKRLIVVLNMSKFWLKLISKVTFSSIIL